MTRHPRRSMSTSCARRRPVHFENRRTVGRGRHAHRSVTSAGRLRCRARRRARSGAQVHAGGRSAAAAPGRRQHGERGARYRVALRGACRDFRVRGFRLRRGPRVLTPILETGAPVYVIANHAAESASAGRADDVLRAVAEQTHGQYTPIYSAASYAVALDRLADRLATEMMIEYFMPAGETPAGDVRVGVKIPGARATGLGVSKILVAALNLLQRFVDQLVVVFLRDVALEELRRNRDRQIHRFARGSAAAPSRSASRSGARRS